MQTLPTQINIRCDADSLARWKVAADRSGRPLAQWLRWVADRASGGDEPTEAPPKPRPKLPPSARAVVTALIATDRQRAVSIGRGSVPAPAFNVASHLEPRAPNLKQPKGRKK